MKTELLAKWAADNQVELTANQLERLQLFQYEVLEANKYMNLTAIVNDTEFTIKHFIDSLTLLPWIKPGVSLVDIGTGAGFPGVPLKIARPDIRLTLLDSTLKRVNFLQKTLVKLGIDDVVCVHARAENWAKSGDELYDVCTARAVAHLKTLAGYALGLLTPGGIFLAMKGPDVLAEVREAEPMIEKFGGAVRESRTVEISDEIRHSVVVVEKVC